MDYIPFANSSNKGGGGNHNRRQNHGRGGGGGGGRYRGGRARGRGGRGRGHGRGRGRFHNNNSNNEIQLNNDIVNIEEIEVPMTENTNGSQTVRIAIQGCAHGALDRIYETLHLYEKERNQNQQEGDKKYKIDLLLCCGDFQSLRNTADFETMAVPPKYREIGSFYKYYSGQMKAPILTVFVGGNHEASAYLQELYYGGWVAPNIYYLGAAGVIRYKGLRIGGISGIYKSFDYYMGRYEQPPYDRGTLRSVYHVRNVDVARMKCLSNNHTNTKHRNGENENGVCLDIMMSHDWPRGIEQHGNTAALLRKKQFFAKEVQENTLGSPPNEELLYALKPKWWFAAHLHVKFSATFHHLGLNDGRASKDHDATSTSGITSSARAEQRLIPSQVQTASSHVPTAKDKTEDMDSTSTPMTAESTTTSFISAESTPAACSSDLTSSHVSDLTDLMTKFLSLDKCLPRKHYMQIINILPQEEEPSSEVASAVVDQTSSLSPSSHKTSSSSLQYDLEWLAILQKTHSWTNNTRTRTPNPDISYINVTDEDIQNVREGLKTTMNHDHNYNENNDETCIPDNFMMTTQPHGTVGASDIWNGGRMIGNPQTDRLLSALGLDHIITVPYILSVDNTDPTLADQSSSSTQCHQPNVDQSEINIDSDLEEIEEEPAAEKANIDPSEIDLESDLEEVEEGDNVAHGDTNEIDIDDI